MTANDLFRNIPQVEKLLADEELAPFAASLGRSVLVSVIRRETEAFRAALKENGSLTVEELVAAVKKRCVEKTRERLQRVINGTGVIIHTNFGRAPLPGTVLDSLASELAGYCNLEFFIPEKRRGKRGGFAEELLTELTGAGDALIVNNNAAAVFLILGEFARGMEVLISRGELVQIGGGFRIPDILRQSGAVLVEVGTTNITTLDDYRNAITDDTAMVLSVHRSNFAVKGFTAEPSLKELASLKREGLLLARDLGSGNLVSDQRLPRPFEPAISWELAQGPDLVCFSGDKLLGAGQAGIIVGGKEHISRLRKNPLMRVLRVDKVSYHILQEVLAGYASGRWEELPVWRMIQASPKEIARRAAKLTRMIPAEFRRHVEAVEMTSTFGGGAMPAGELESRGVAVTVPGLSADDIYDHFINGPVPVAGVIVDEKFCLDLRTVFDRDLPDIAASLERLLAGRNG